jgi:hypothetical protein
MIRARGIHKSYSRTVLSVYPFIKTSHPKHMMQETEEQNNEVCKSECNLLTDPQPSQAATYQLDQTNKISQTNLPN